MLFITVTLLMMQLQSFSLLFLVLSVVPLGLIGVVAALLLFRQPLGFVAILGILSLLGMIARNGVILIDQIQAVRAEGVAVWNAVIEAATSRFRPIMLGDIDGARHDPASRSRPTTGANGMHDPPKRSDLSLLHRLLVRPGRSHQMEPT
jgi:hypothetical protein